MSSISMYSRRLTVRSSFVSRFVILLLRILFCLTSVVLVLCIALSLCTMSLSVLVVDSKKSSVSSSSSSLSPAMSSSSAYCCAVLWVGGLVGTLSVWVSARKRVPDLGFWVPLVVVDTARFRLRVLGLVAIVWAGSSRVIGSELLGGR